MSTIELSSNLLRQVVIIGSGPAGYTAAIYAARAGLEPLLVASSVEAGGELMNTTDVENYPGFPEGVQGPDLMVSFEAQAERFGTEILLDDVIAVDLSGEIKTVTLGSGDVVQALSVIIATGSAYRKLGLADEERLSGRGVSWCATCDGFFFKGKTVAVSGGGDSAIEEATFLTRFADKVYVVHRRDELRASKVMQDRAFDNEKIEFVWNSVITQITGDDSVTGIVVNDLVTGQTSTLDVQGLFVAIGSDPRTALFAGQVELNADGTIAVMERTSKTSLTGVFAAGDVTDPTYRQAITAAGTGCVAAIDAEHHLATLSAEMIAQTRLPATAEISQVGAS